MAIATNYNSKKSLYLRLRLYADDIHFGFELNELLDEIANYENKQSKDVYEDFSEIIACVHHGLRLTNIGNSQYGQKWLREFI